MRAQIGSISLPILATPRIDGTEVTVSQIKTLYSSKFVSDETTPMNFYLQYADIDGNETDLLWDSTKSSDSLLYFPVPDAVYETVKNYSVLVYWTVSDLTPTVIEKIFTEQPLVLAVQNQHTQI